MGKTIKYPDYTIIIGLFVFSVLFVFFNSKNSPLYLFNEWGDANIYFSMGKGMMNGLIPYKDIFDHKGPFIFFLYGIAYLISDTTFLGVYILECIALFINIFFAFKIARLYLNNLFSFITALSYSVFLFSKTYLGGSAEEFISVFVTISFYYFILYFTNRRRKDKDLKYQMIVHGIMFTLTLLSKLSVCVFWIPLVLAILFEYTIQKKYSKIFISGAYFLVGSILTLLPFVIYFGVNNSLTDFYNGYIQFNSIYAEFNPTLNTLRTIAAHFYKLLRGDFIIFSILLLGVFVLSFTKKYIEDPIYRIGVFLSFVFSFIMMCITKYIMTYAHIVIYPYALFGLIFLFGLIKWKSDKYNMIIYLISFIVFLGIGIKDKNFFSDSEDIDCVLRKKKECNYMQKEFASIINQEKNPTLLDLGLDHGLYTKANIIPSYKYFFYPNIPYRIYPEIRDYQEKLIENKEPMFIVAGNTSWYYGYIKELPFFEKNYQLVGIYYQNIGAFDTEVYLYKRK